MLGFFRGFEVVGMLGLLGFGFSFFLDFWGFRFLRLHPQTRVTISQLTIMPGLPGISDPCITAKGLGASSLA